MTSAFVDQRLTAEEARALRDAVVEYPDSAKCVTLELVFHQQLHDIFHGQRALRLEEESSELTGDWRHSAVELPAITETTEKDFEVAAPSVTLRPGGFASAAPDPFLALEKNGGRRPAGHHGDGDNRNASVRGSCDCCHIGATGQRGMGRELCKNCLRALWFLGIACHSNPDFAVSILMTVLT